MTYDKILSSPDGTVIKEISGRIVKVYDPRDPTPAQAKAGIHPQGFVIQNNQGESLDMRFIAASQHIDRSSEGKMFHFQSMPSNGKMDGIIVQRYMNKNNEERISIKVTKAAHFYEIEEAQAPELPPVAEDKPEAKTNPTKVRPSVGSLVSLFSSITRELEFQLEGTKVIDSLLAEPRGFAAAASTIFIEACKQGLQFDGCQVVANVLTPAEKPEPQAPQPISTLEGLVKYCTTEGADPERIKSYASSLDIRFPDLYDACYATLDPAQFSDADINAAWDSVMKSLEDGGKAPSSGMICEAIVCDWQSYLISLEVAKTFVNGKPKHD